MDPIYLQSSEPIAIPYAVDKNIQINELDDFTATEGLEIIEEEKRSEIGNSSSRQKRNLNYDSMSGGRIQKDNDGASNSASNLLNVNFSEMGGDDLLLNYTNYERAAHSEIRSPSITNQSRSFSSLNPEKKNEMIRKQIARYRKKEDVLNPLESDRQGSDLDHNDYNKNQEIEKLTFQSPRQQEIGNGYIREPLTSESRTVPKKPEITSIKYVLKSSKAENADQREEKENSMIKEKSNKGSNCQDWYGERKNEIDLLDYLEDHNTKRSQNLCFKKEGSQNDLTIMSFESKLNSKDCQDSETKLITFISKPTNEPNNIRSRKASQDLDSSKHEKQEYYPYLKAKNATKSPENRKKQYSENDLAKISEPMDREKLMRAIEDKLSKEFDFIYYEIKNKLRQQQEDKIKENLKLKLHSKVEEEIRKQDYEKIKSQIKLENMYTLQFELDKYNQEQKVSYEAKFNNFKQNSNIESQFEKEVRKELEIQNNSQLLKREKEEKALFLRKLEIYKNNVFKEIDKEYKLKTESTIKEISQLKSSLFQLKCSEKVKVYKLSQLKTDLLANERRQLESAQRLEKAISKKSRSTTNISKRQVETASDSIKANNAGNLSHLEKEDRSFIRISNPTRQTIETIERLEKDNYPFKQKDSREEGMLNQNKLKHMGYKVENSKNSFSIFELNNYLKKKIISGNNDELKTKSNLGNYIQEEMNLQISNPKITNGVEHSPQSIAVNSSNNKMQQSKTQIKPNFSNNNSIQETKVKQDSSIEVTINPKGNIIENQQQNSPMLKHSCSATNLYTEDFSLYKKEIQSQEKPNKPIQSNLQQGVHNGSFSLYQECESLKLCFDFDVSNPSIFEKNLQYYKDKEENYKNLFINEVKSMKANIKKAFEVARTSDHSLTDFLIEQWNKLDVPFELRYKILSSLRLK